MIVVFIDLVGFTAPSMAYGDAASIVIDTFYGTAPAEADRYSPSMIKGIGG